MLDPQLINAHDLLPQYDRGYRDFRRSKLQSIDVDDVASSRASAKIAISLDQQVHAE